MGHFVFIFIQAFMFIVSVCGIYFLNVYCWIYGHGLVGDTQVSTLRIGNFLCTEEQRRSNIIYSSS